MKFSTLVCFMLLASTGTFFSQTALLHSFITETNVMFHNNPCTDGEFIYGTKYDGGANGEGYLYKVNINGTGYAVLLNFERTITGAYPAGSLILKDNKLYGVTHWGGQYDKGVIFKIGTDGAGYQKIFDFSSGNIAQSLTLLNGTFYGVLEGGGTYQKGMVFKIGMDGTGFEDLHSFNETDGMQPSSPLITDGISLFGTTSRGGEHDEGVVFKINSDGTDFSVMHTFSYNDGSHPSGDLVLIHNSIYGTVLQGGANYAGTLYKMHTNGSGFTVLVDFSLREGINPQGIIARDLMLYGMTTNGGNGSGIVFSVDTTGRDFSTLVRFDKSNGACPVSVMTCFGDKLYGYANGGTYNYGVLFELNTTDSGIRIIKNFVATNHGYDPKGALLVSPVRCYGLTKSGGNYNKGVLFSMNRNGSEYGINYDFTGDDGADPIGSMVQHENELYGMTQNGGANGQGTAFRYHINGGTFEKMYDFTYETGNAPTGTCIYDSRIYGITAGGGMDNAGGVFSLNLDGSEYTQLFSFSGTSLSMPRGALAVSESVLFGMSKLASNGNDVLFSVRTDGTDFTILYTSNGVDAGENGVSLITDGEYLYEITSNGGLHNMGVLFKIKKDGSGFEKLIDFSDATGGVPQEPLILENAFLYGATSIGSPSQTGALFRVKTDGTGFENLIDFESCFGLPFDAKATPLADNLKTQLSHETALGASSTRGFVTLTDNSIYILASQNGAVSEMSKVFRYDLVPVFEAPDPGVLDFGKVDIHTNSAVQSYSLTGMYFSENVTVTAPTGFQISETLNGTYRQSLTLTPVSGLLHATIYVRFSPSQAISYAGNMAHESTGAETVFVEVSGTGLTHDECPPVATPANFLASQGALCDHVHLQWDSVTGALSYSLYRGNALLTTTTNLSFDDFEATTTAATYKIFANSDCTISLPGSTTGYSAALPVVHLGEDITVFSDTILILDAGAGFAGYDWSTGTTGQTLVLDGLGSGSYNYSVVITDQHGCTATDTVKITVNIPTRIPESGLKLAHTLYPNPSSGKIALTLSANQQVPEFRVYVYSMSGELLDHMVYKTSVGSVYYIDLHQPPGTYELLIRYGGVLMKDKLVIR